MKTIPDEISKKQTQISDFGPSNIYFKVYFWFPPNKANGGKKFFM